MKFPHSSTYYQWGRREFVLMFEITTVTHSQILQCPAQQLPCRQNGGMAWNGNGCIDGDLKLKMFPVFSCQVWIPERMLDEWWCLWMFMERCSGLQSALITGKDTYSYPWNEFQSCGPCLWFQSHTWTQNKIDTDLSKQDATHEPECSHIC